MLLFRYKMADCRGKMLPLQPNIHLIYVFIMATAIKAIPTLRGKEAREFLRHAEEAERNYKGTTNRDDHSFCLMAHAILSKAGML